MISRLTIDFETRSRVDLKRHGAARYFACPDARIILAAVSIDGAPARCVTLTDCLALGARAELIVAHNAEFERAAIAAAITSYLPYGVGELARRALARRWVCTSAMARLLSLPGDLSKLSAVCGGAQKQADGHRLIRKFCLPNKETNDFCADPLVRNSDPDWQRFVNYCADDVNATNSAFDFMRARLTDSQFSNYLRDYAAHLEIAERGVQIDTWFIARAVTRCEQLGSAAQSKVKDLTGLNATQNLRIMEYASAALGREVTSLDKASVAAILKDDGTPDVLRAVLEARADVQSSSVKKLTSALDRNIGGRLKNWCALYGASRTGRFAARGVQVQNMPRVPKGYVPYDPETAALAELVGGMRGMLQHAGGAEYVALDWANIESRVLAWQAGEEWKLDAFRAQDAGGTDVYTLTARRLGVDRQGGKVAELACGYQGGRGAFAVFAAAYGLTISDLQADAMRDAWRAQHPNIVSMWYAYERAWKACAIASHTGKPLTVKVNSLTFAAALSSVVVTLPSGRALRYWKPRVTADACLFVNYQKGGSLTSTYGGKLTENITQAICADLLLRALSLCPAGSVYMHAHDEIVSSLTDAPEIEKLMLGPPPWLPDCPLAVSAKRMTRYDGRLDRLADGQSDRVVHRAAPRVADGGNAGQEAVD